MKNIKEQTFKKLQCCYEEGHLSDEEWSFIEHLYKHIWNETDLFQWYIKLTGEGDTPIWTEEHIEELYKDFILIKKEDEKV